MTQRKANKQDNTNCKNITTCDIINQALREIKMIIKAELNKYKNGEEVDILNYKLVFIKGDNILCDNCICNKDDRLDGLCLGTDCENGAFFEKDDTDE